MNDELNKEQWVFAESSECDRGDREWHVDGMGWVDNVQRSGRRQRQYGGRNKM